MDVVFQADVINRFTLKVKGHGSLYFNRGSYITQDKNLIRKLINHPLLGRSFSLQSNEEQVAKYLDGEESDKLTKEVLNNITRQGILELGKELASQQTQPTLIKIELVGKPITNKVQEIVDFYQIEKTKEEVQEEIVREDKQVETITNTVSTDLSAKDAVEYIKSTSFDELEGFVTEQEDRVTVLNAWEDK